jgi:hypothetical protein
VTGDLEAGAQLEGQALLAAAPRQLLRPESSRTRAVESTPNAPKTEALYQVNSPFSDQIVSRVVFLLQRRDNSPRGPHQLLGRLRGVAAGQVRIRFRNINLSPFHRMEQVNAPITVYMAFAIDLGSTNPRPNAEPWEVVPPASRRLPRGRRYSGADGERPAFRRRGYHPLRRPVPGRFG